jgi:hypothetical protein
MQDAMKTSTYFNFGTYMEITAEIHALYALPWAKNLWYFFDSRFIGPQN